MRTLYFCLLVGSGTPQRHPAKNSSREVKASENPFSHLSNTTYTQLCSVRRTASEVCHRVLATVGLPHTHTHGMTAHHCPLIKTSFHSHPHSLSPSLLHSPMVLPSSPPLPRSLLRPAFTSCRLPFSFLLTPPSSPTFPWHTLTY